MAQPKINPLNAKDEFILVYYTQCDPGYEFDVISKYEIVGDTNVELTRGLEIKVHHDIFRVPAMVAYTASSVRDIQSNLEVIVPRFFKYRQELKKQRQNDDDEVEANTESVADQTSAAKDELDEALEEMSRNYDKLSRKIKDEEMLRNSTDKYLQRFKRSYFRLRSKTRELTSSLGSIPKVGQPSSSKKSESGSKYENDESFGSNIENREVVTKSEASSSTNEVDENDSIERKPLREQNISAKKNIFYVPQLEQDQEFVYIGENRTPIPREVYYNTNWGSHTAATRKLLITVFNRDILATHTLSGKPSPAFLNADKESKQKLDPKKVADIVDIVSKNSNVTRSVVRSAITTKCADENKMKRKRIEKGTEEDENAFDDVDLNRSEKKYKPRCTN